MHPGNAAGARRGGRDRGLGPSSIQSIQGGSTGPAPRASSTQLLGRL